jgi:hypothetical protein
MVSFGSLNIPQMAAVCLTSGVLAGRKHLLGFERRRARETMISLSKSLLAILGDRKGRGVFSARLTYVAGRFFGLADITSYRGVRTLMAGAVAGAVPARLVVAFRLYRAGA